MYLILHFGMTINIFFSIKENNKHISLLPQYINNFYIFSLYNYSPVKIDKPHDKFYFSLYPCLRKVKIKALLSPEEEHAHLLHFAQVSRPLVIHTKRIESEKGLIYLPRPGRR